MKFTNTITIDRPREEAFAFLSDLENLPRWNYAIQQTRKVTAGPVAVGTRYHQVRTVPTRQEETLEIAELDQPRRLTVRGTLSTLPAQLDYELESRGGTTVVTNTVELTVPGPLVLVSVLATRRVKPAVAQNLQVMKQVLEGGNG
jgi:carbon monoxide dehydrogenase subunit G